MRPAGYFSIIQTVKLPRCWETDAAFFRWKPFVYWIENKTLIFYNNYAISDYENIIILL